MGKKKSKAAPKAKRQAVKKVEISRFGNGFAWENKTGTEYDYQFASPFTAKRGAERHFKEFIAKGGKLVFIKNY